MGDFKTEKGCVVKVRPGHEDMEPGSVVLSLRVDHPAHVGSVAAREEEPHLIQYAEVVLTPIEMKALASLLGGPPVEEVRNAWTDPGHNPSYHHSEKARLFRQWPTLARALDRLTREVPGG